MAITALVAASAAASAATLFGITSLAALAAIGLGAAAVFDYVMDSMMEDIAVDTMGGRTVTKKDPTASRKLIYGTVRTGGTIVYQANSGEDNKYLHNFVIFSEGANEEISEIYFDDVKVYGTHPIADGYYYYNKYSTNPEAATVDGNKVEIQLKTGAGYAGISGGEIPNQWTGAHQLSKLCYAYIRLEYSDEIYTNGFPKITAIIKGRKLYDPRQDSTATAYSGSGSQRIDDTSTWEYSNNSAVCLLNYMLDDRIGLGESLDAFDAPSLLASMNDCDVDIPLSAGGTQKKYTCDGIIDSKNSHKANIQNILTSMNGQLLYSGGKYHVKSYNYETPHSQVVTEDMILGNIDIATKASRRSLYNRVKGKFVSEEDNYVMTEYPAQIYYTAGTTTKQFEIDDGETLYHEYNLPMTTNNVRAQRLARLTMLRSRMQSSIKFTTNAKGLLYTVGDNIKVTNSTLGITEKVYQIQRLNVRPDAEKGLTVSIEAKENVEDFYNWSTTDELTFTSGLTVSLFDGAVSAPTNLILEPYFKNGKSMIKASWTPSTSQGDIIYKVYYRNNIYSAYQPIYQPNTYESSMEIHVKDEFEQYPIQVVVQAMRQASGVVSDSLIGTTVAAKINNDNPNNIIRSTIQSPNVAEITALCEEAGIALVGGTEITYLYVVDGEVVDSTDFVFEKQELSAIPQKVNNEIVAETFSNVVANSTFSTSSDWIFAEETGAFEITGGKLVYNGAAGLEFVYQTLTGLEVGKTYTASVTISNSALGANGIGIAYYDTLTKNLISVGATILTDGTHTHEFIAPSDEVFLVITDASATGSADIDDLTFTRQDEKAEHFVTVSLPASVTTGVTWQHSESNATGIDDAGVTTTFNHFVPYFTPSHLVNGRPSVEIGLTRPSSSAGFSQHTVTVTAFWREDVSLGGITQTLDKSATIDVVLSVRVV